MLNLDDSDVKAMNEEIVQIGFKMIPEAIKAKPEDFDRKFDEYLEEINQAGLEKVTREYESAMKDRIDLWN